MSKKTKTLELRNLGSLITYLDGETGQECCLGYLMPFTGHGVYDATYGKVEVTPEQAETHNKLLSAAQIQGLDKCEVGQCGDFYFNAETKRVATFIGELVTEAASFTKNSVYEFTRKGRRFRFKRRKGDDCVTVKRIA